MRAREFPLNIVEIQCDYCGRFGRYSKTRFVELVGEETMLSEALTIIAQDCQEDRASVANLNGKCRPYYPQDWWR